VEILDANNKTKPDIEYPINWGFKLIGRDKAKLEACIAEILADKEHQKSAGNASAGGKFHSFNASCEVLDEEERNKLFKAFSEHEHVKMVI